MLVKCPCNNCSGHVEFDSQDVGRTIECPHCGLETLLFVPQRPLDPPPPPVVPPPVSHLRTCADCGQTVSVHAEACPHCGASFGKKHGVFYYMSFGVISLLAALFLLFIGYGFFTDPMLTGIPLSGEIFIVTKGGANIKLGLVAVGLFSIDALEPNLAAKRKRDAELSFYVSGDFYFADLPPAVKVAKSNADGRFQMQVPAEGRYALLARAQRQVGDKAEKYFWALKLNTSGRNRISIMLSNDNMTSSKSPDSLFETTSD